MSLLLTGAGTAKAAQVVALDQLASASAVSASGTSMDFTNQSINSGLSNPALVVCITQTTATNLSGMTAHWDADTTNQLMTQVSQFNTVNGQVWILALLNPTPGTNLKLHLNWTGTGQVIVGSLSLKFVNPASVGAAFINATGANGAAPTMTTTVTSAPGDMVITSFATTGFITNTYSGTEIYTNNGGGTWDAAASRDPGASPSVVVTGVTTNQWLATSIDVVHA